MESELFCVPDLGLELRVGVEVTLPDQQRTPASFLRAQRSSGIFQIPLRLRPAGSSLMPPILNAFGRAMLHQTVRQLAAASDDHPEQTPEAIFNQLLLALWAELFWERCEDWRARGAANLPSERARHLGTWFLRGRRIHSGTGSMIPAPDP